MAPGMILDLLLSGMTTMRLPAGIEFTPYAEDLLRAERAYAQYNDDWRERMARAKSKSTGVGIYDPLFEGKFQIGGWASVPIDAPDDEIQVGVSLDRAAD